MPLSAAKGIDRVWRSDRGKINSNIIVVVETKKKRKNSLKVVIRHCTRVPDCHDQNVLLTRVFSILFFSPQSLRGRKTISPPFEIWSHNFKVSPLLWYPVQELWFFTMSHWIYLHGAVLQVWKHTSFISRKMILPSSPWVDHRLFWVHTDQGPDYPVASRREIYVHTFKLQGGHDNINKDHFFKFQWVSGTRWHER